MKAIWHEKVRQSMFEKGAFVVHQSAGVCEVMDITKLKMDGANQDKLYYYLRPCYQKNSKIFIPVDKEEAVLRPILTGVEAASLIDAIPQIEELWVENEKLRESVYREALKSSDCKERVRIIKTLYVRRKERTAQGKKISAVDEKYLHLAEEHLYSELSLTIGIPKEKMEDFITEKMHLLQYT